MFRIGHKVPRSILWVELDEAIIATDEKMTVRLFIEMMNMVAHLRERWTKHLLWLMSILETIKSTRPHAQPESTVARLQHGVASATSRDIAYVDSGELVRSLVETEKHTACIGTIEPNLIIAVNVDAWG